MLSLPVRQSLLQLAAESDLFLLGELHGTQEVPLLLTELLSDLGSLGYGALALELPHGQREAIATWATGASPAVPPFFLRPAADGRESEQMLALIRTAANAGWPILCFDIDPEEWSEDWQARDSDMATHLAKQWEQECPAAKAVGVCGSFHSRLAPPTNFSPELWPSFAACFQERHPTHVVRSVYLVFHNGSFHNHGVKELLGEPLAEAKICEDTLLGHSLALHLPRATPATFLTAPARGR